MISKFCPPFPQKIDLPRMAWMSKRTKNDSYNLMKVATGILSLPANMKLLALLVVLPFLVAAEVDTSKLQWSVLSAKLQVPQSDMTASLGPDGKVYIAGGCVSPTGSIYNENSQILQCNQDTDIMYSFDPATNTFQNLPRLPRNRCRHGAAIANGKLFLIGGRTAIGDELIPEIDVSYVLFSCIIRCM
jgi:hypothetical protein